MSSNHNIPIYKDNPMKIVQYKISYFGEICIMIKEIKNVNLQTEYNGLVLKSKLTGKLKLTRIWKDRNSKKDIWNQTANENFSTVQALL